MASRIILAAIVVALVSILSLSDRPWGFTSMPRIAEIGVVPGRGEATEAIRRYTEIGSGKLPYMADEARPAADARPPLKVGWSYREQIIFRMPLWSTTDMGMVTYFELPDGIQFGMLNASLEARLAEQADMPELRGYSFPWYRHVWGWWLIAALILWSLVKSREDARRDRAQ